MTKVVLSWSTLLHSVLLAHVYEKFTDPIDRIFGLLAQYREAILSTDCTYGCPIGRLALEIAPEYRDAHKLLTENFAGWTEAVHESLEAGRDRFVSRIRAYGDGEWCDAVAFVSQGGAV